MLIIADKKLPADVHQALAALGDLLLTATSGVVYDAISGHPDIFFCKVNEILCVSPGLDEHIYRILGKRNIPYILGAAMPGLKYPDTAAYNLAITGHIAIHNFNCTDHRLSELCAAHRRIQVKQGYSRCNIIPLGDYGIITSDDGIHATAVANGMNSLLVAPQGILLPGFNHGFIGGCCGVHHKHVYVTGSLSFHPQGAAIREFIGKAGYAVTELYQGPLFDGGSLVFLE